MTTAAELTARNERTVYVGDPEAYPLDEEMVEIQREESQPLQKVFPAEFDRYLNRFYKFWTKKPVHVRQHYGGGFACVKRSTKKGDKVEQACYPDMLARHLDLERWQHNHPNVRHPEYFWVAMREPRASTLKAIDFDNKDNVLGYYRTRAHGITASRPLPILTVDHLQAIKRIYDAFPNHTWCVSSSTLGLHIWEKYARPLPLHEIDARNRPILARIGLGSTEIHPMVGRAFRRPFGQDYFTIAADGLIEDWRQQLDYFENTGCTPSFEAIFSDLRQVMIRGWERYRGTIETGKLRPNSKHEKLIRRFFRSNRWSPGLLDHVLEELDRWAEDGFETVPVTSGLATNMSSAKRSQIGGDSAGIWTCKFHGDWLQKCKAWALNGLPAEDSMSFVVLQLARWFIHVEFFEDEGRFDRTVTLLDEFCRTKSNGFISRLNQGFVSEVAFHVRRIVTCANKPLESKQVKVFEDIRHKRGSGVYKSVYHLEDLIRGPIEGTESSTSSSPVLFTQCCTLSRLQEPNQFLSPKEYWRQRAKTWNPELDNRELPKVLNDRILGYFAKKGLKVKKPTIVKISRFLWHLLGSPGDALLSTKALKAFGFSNDRSLQLIHHLEAMGAIHIKGYCPSAGISRGFRLTETARRLFDEAPSTDS